MVNARPPRTDIFEFILEKIFGNLFYLPLLYCSAGFTCATVTEEEEYSYASAIWGLSDEYRHSASSWLSILAPLAFAYFVDYKKSYTIPMFINFLLLFIGTALLCCPWIDLSFGLMARETVFFLTYMSYCALKISVVPLLNSLVLDQLKVDPVRNIGSIGYYYVFYVIGAFSGTTMTKSLGPMNPLLAYFNRILYAAFLLILLYLANIRTPEIFQKPKRDESKFTSTDKGIFKDLYPVDGRTSEIFQKTEKEKPEKEIPEKEKPEKKESELKVPWYHHKFLFIVLSLLSTETTFAYLSSTIKDIFKDLLKFEENNDCFSLLRDLYAPLYVSTFVLSLSTRLLFSSIGSFWMFLTGFGVLVILIAGLILVPEAPSFGSFEQSLMIGLRAIGFIGHHLIYMASTLMAKEVVWQSSSALAQTIAALALRPSLSAPLSEYLIDLSKVVSNQITIQLAFVSVLAVTLCLMIAIKFAVADRVIFKVDRSEQEPEF